MFRAPKVPAIDVTEAAQAVEAGALMIDVRETEEWEASRIPGAEFRPMSEINSWYADLPRDREIIVQCRSGRRSADVVHALRSQAGFENVTNLTGGIIAWVNAELPVDETPLAD